MTNPIKKKFSNGTLKLPPQHHLQELLHYQPETGDLFWKVSKKGVTAGTMVSPAPNAKGYKFVMIDGCHYKQHRVIYKLMTGKDPGLKKVDHRDRNTSNNRWSNLRLGTQGDNSCNRVGHSKSGYKGVYETPSGKFQASIKRKGVSKCLGTYASPLDAHTAYSVAAKELFGEFANNSHISDPKNFD